MTFTKEKMTKKETHLEMAEGVDGSGRTIYFVNTVCNKTGRWLWMERFTSKKEAEHWMKWA